MVNKEIKIEIEIEKISVYLHPLDSVPLFFRKWIAIHTGMTRHTATKKKKKKNWL